jgi:hypothetical protein
MFPFQTAHSKGIKRNYLFIVAVLFVCAMGLFLNTSHILDERGSAPTLPSQKTERVLKKPVLPKPKLPKKPPKRHFAP